ncbi:MAG: orotidine-5'-phosphate decarboxylase [Candidatus Aureabacteria bacterium]|nr:orotidine-5'-phosphate decarboxylase [Candidatus Auribacterota bacterium]
MGTRIILALDVDSKTRAISHVLTLKNDVALFKVGKQLFTRYGPSVIRQVQQAGGKVFLDLKFHDIPNTVALACREAVRLGVNMLTIHATGGGSMMKAAVESVQKASCEFKKRRPVILAVTVLTSISNDMLKNELRCGLDIQDQVAWLAHLAQKAGVDGVVASPEESVLIRKACGESFMIVTPGVRPEWADKHDQKRVMTPLEAVKAGADYVVIGRPVISHSDPLLAVRMINKELGVKSNCGR